MSFQEPVTANEVPIRIPEQPKRRDPLIVAIHGGPGVGKSTTAALVFGALKKEGINVEFVSEIAKGFTWEERWTTLANQPYVISKQLRDYDRLYGKVDCIVTDTSSLLGLIYGREQASPEVTHAFRNWLVADWKARRTINVFLERDAERPYDDVGRYQTEEEALQIDARVWNLLMTLDIPVMNLNVDKDSDAYCSEIVDEVLRCLRP